MTADAGASVDATALADRDDQTMVVERAPPARVSPPRAAVRLSATGPPTVEMYFAQLRTLIDLHHEYPGETFYVFEDRGPAVSDRRHGEPTVVSAVCAYLALGLRESQAVLCRLVDVPQTFQVLWTLRNIQRSRRLARQPVTRADAGYDAGISVTPAMLFGLAGVLVRATTIAASSADMTAYRYARRTAAVFNAFVARNVLAMPLVRPIGDLPAPAFTSDSGATLSPFDSRDALERVLLDIWAEAQARNAEGSLRQAWTRLAMQLTIADRIDDLPHQPGMFSAWRSLAPLLATAIEAHFAEAAVHYHALRARPGHIWDVLADGAGLAGEQATLTLSAMRDALGESWMEHP